MKMLVPGIYKDLFINDKGYHSFVALTGRSSGKTFNFAQYTINKCEETQSSAIIVIKNDNDIEQGIYQTFKKLIRKLGITYKYNFRISKKTIEAKSGKYKIMFKSVADDPGKTKGTDTVSDDVCVLWFEEIGRFSPGDLKSVRETVFRILRDDGVTLYSGNPPQNPHHWTRIWQDKVKLLPGYKIFTTTFLDVYDLLTDANKREIAETYRMNPEEFNQVYLAMPEANTSVVYQELSEKHIIPINQEMDAPIVQWCLAVDIGVSHDKTAIIFMFRLANNRIITKKVWTHDPTRNGEITVNVVADFVEKVYDRVKAGVNIGGATLDIHKLKHNIVVDTHDFGLTRELVDRGLPAVKIRNKNVYKDIEKGKMLLNRNIVSFMNYRGNSYPCAQLINEMLVLSWVVDKETGKRVSNNTSINNKWVVGEDDCENAWRYGHKYLLKGITITKTLQPLGSYKKEEEELIIGGSN